MDLTQYVEELKSQLTLAAAASGEDARAIAERLTSALESSARLVLLEAISAAAAEITLDLAPGSVDVRLRGREPEFVVTPPTADRPVEDVPPPSQPPPVTEGDETGTSRITLRLPEHLKSRVEAAAGRDGVSVNSWLVRAASAAVGATDPQRRGPRSSPVGGQSFTGWAR